MKKIFSNILLSFSLVSLSVPILVSEMNYLSVAVVSAVSDESNVIDDLFTDESFKTDYLHGEYTIDSSKDEFDVLYVVESGYSLNHQDYDLVLYVRNISGKGFDTYNFENKYNSVEFYSFATYKAFSLDMKYINCSADYQFIKYRIKDVDQVNFINSESGRREYGIKGIEIAHFDGNLQKFKEYPVAKKWNFDGDRDDLFITYNSSFEYLQLDLGSGAFPFSRWSEYKGSFPWMPSSRWEVTHQQNLYYVYFSIPKTYHYSDSLYSIHADYYDFNLSQKILFVFDDFDQNFYEENYDYFDQLLKDNYSVSDEILSDFKNNFIFHSYFDHYRNAQNLDYYYSIHNEYPCFIVNNYLQETDYLAYDSQWSDPLHYFSSSNWLLKNPLMISLGKSGFGADNYYFEVDGHLIGDMFDRFTAERVSGISSKEVYHEINYCNPGTGREDSDAIEVSWDLVSEVYNHWYIWRWWHDVSDELNVQDLKCIQRIDSLDFSLSDESFKTKYYVNSNDISDIKSRLDDFSDTYLFRFKLSDSSSIPFIYGDPTNDPYHYCIAGFQAMEYEGVVDFDVLDLTFVNDDDKLETMPIVSDPINVFPDITLTYSKSGCSGGSWILFLWILLILILIIGILLLIKYILPTFSNLRLASATRQSKRIEKQRLKVEEERLKLEHSKLRKQRKGGSRYVSRSKRGKTKYKKKKRC